MSIFSRKKWEELGQSTASEIMYKEQYGLGARTISLKDTFFQSVPFEDFMAVYGKACKPIPKWMKDIWDCDNMAMNRIAAIQLKWAKLSKGDKPLAFGYVEGRIEAGWHAFLWHRDHKGIYRFIEPQTDKLAKYEILEFREFWGC